MEGSVLIVEVPGTVEAQPDPADGSAPAKKSFVAPEISVPVDVLEATTFFQVATSGASN